MTLLFALLRAMRPHQWVKNLLIFVPIVTAHQMFVVPTVVRGLLAFAAFSVTASGVYLLNDLVDLESDRQHPTKCRRPLASGALSPWLAGLSVPILWIGAAVLAYQLNPRFWGALGVYVLVTVLYSTLLKRLVIVDVLCLAFLYTWRALAGIAAAEVDYSPWFLAFLMFFFFGLALMKRAGELHLARSQGHQIKGRQYRPEDLESVTIMGVASSFMAVQVLAIYIDNSANVARLYAHPEALWLLCPVLFYWIGRVWLLTGRGRMHDDPVVFALKDAPSYLCAALMLVIMVAASRTL